METPHGCWHVRQNEMSIDRISIVQPCNRAVLVSFGNKKLLLPPSPPKRKNLKEVRNVKL